MEMDRIYHITHVCNVPGIVARGGLVCDRERRRLGFECQEIGYAHIKERRLRRQIDLPPGGTLGDFVPFYFCPRSVMLYVIHQRNTDYKGGQEQIVHLEVSIPSAVAEGRPWLFTDRHAEMGFAGYYCDLADLTKLPWNVIHSNDWGGDERRHQKQAEFLVHTFLTWSCVGRIGVQNREVAAQVEQALKSSSHKPPVSVQPSWYY